MTTLFVVLIVLASAILGLIVLVQNPKGGGLAGNIAGFSNQFMGVKQTTDVLEKGTWVFAGVIGVLCLLSVLFISKSSTSGPDRTKDATTAPIPSTNQPAPTNNNTIQLNPQPAGDSTK
ncbi:MAG: preprotein translocase subunit SecG [Chitinophagaceae bacterium]|mgnify:CR=1 FL=1|nr:preprotein translocase subunit SecG [Chitinophagaceae bacterium]